MSGVGDSASRSDVVALSARVQELEAQLIRTSIGAARAEGNTNGCTNCDTNGCTNCAGDRFVNVLLPGEEERLSGAELVKRLRVSRPSAPSTGG